LYRLKRGTLIRAENGIKTIAAVHSRCRRRVIFDRDEASSRSCHFGCAPESRNKIKVLKLPRQAIAVDGVAGRVIQAPKQEHRIMRYELTDFEWVAIKPFAPNKPRSVPRVNDRRVLNGIFWVLHSGAP
jgi:hypothetical protein